MQRRSGVYGLAAAAGALLLTAAALGDPKPDFPDFKDVAKGYEKVISTADGASPLYNLWLNEKDQQLLAELPRGYQNQKHLFAITQASGGVFAGLQGPVTYAYWKRYDDRLALIQPQTGTRSTGEAESRDSVDRLFTDRVILDLPIVCIGPSGQPVIDLDGLLLGQSGALMGGGMRFGGGAGRMNSHLATVKKAKAFPENIEVAIEAPNSGGQLQTLHYSISRIPDNTGYKPRKADERIGYFMTVYRDLGEYKEDEKWVRYINRWHLEKRDPSLKMSPPKEPIVFYIEHTVPVRYRRYVRDGVLAWNKAFEQVGLDGAIQVRFQDKVTGAYMDVDPEDVRYNFIRWLNNDISTAIGPSRAHPLTGQILDADVVLTDGWIRAYWGWFHEQAPELAVESLTPETLQWLEDYPEWDPRMLLSTPKQREHLEAWQSERKRALAAGEEVPPMPSDPALLFNPDLAEIEQWVGGGNGHGTNGCAHDAHCLLAHGMAFDMAFGGLALEAMNLIPEFAEQMEGEGNGEMLDGIPDWFVGPLLKELVAHEVGHTLGLRHNFKSSAIYTMEEINSEEFKGKKPFAGSVMDYLPPNFNMETGEIQGDFAMIDIGPYDMWAIEYGYTFDDPKEVVKRVADPELVYLTDDDTGGPDPLARRYDFSADPHTYAENQMRIVNHQRKHILDKFVEEGESWSKARRGYGITLSMQMRMTSMMANWIGGSHVSRARKGDPDAGPPVSTADAEKQRKALDFVVKNMFVDEAFGLTPELLAHMTVDKWSDQSPGDRGSPAWPVHDTISAYQSSVLTMILNPTTLSRVYDNEFRTPTEEDAITVAEIFRDLYDAIYSELENNDLDGATYTERKPLISSLRRNLQSNMTDRLIVLAEGTPWLPRAVRTLALQHLRDLDVMLPKLVDGPSREQIDAYTLAHLEDLQDRVDKALNAIYVQN